MAKQDRGIENIANTIGGMGRAHVKQQRPLATAQESGKTAPKPQPTVSKAKAMNDFAHANDFLKRYDKPAAKPSTAPRAKATAVKKAGRGR